MKNKLLLLVGAIVLIAAGFAGGYWYGQKVINDQLNLEIESLMSDDQGTENQEYISELPEDVTAETEQAVQ